MHFCSLKGFGRLEAIASLDAYQISKPYKNLSFFIAWFLKNSRKRVSKSGVLRPIAWAGVIKKFIWFFKNCAPRGTEISYSNGFKTKGSVYRDGFITNSNPQFFQLFEKYFHFHFLRWLYGHDIYSFLETSARFRMTKCLKHKSIYFMHMLTLKQGWHFSKNIFTNENIHDQKTNKNCP